MRAEHLDIRSGEIVGVQALSAKLLNQLARYHDLAVNAQRRAMQYAGFETGRKAYARFEHYQQKFSETLNALESRCEMDGANAAKIPGSAEVTCTAGSGGGRRPSRSASDSR